MIVSDRLPPNPYDYSSDGDYYAALDEYNKWLEDRDEIEGEMIDLAYEKSLEEKWDQEQTKQ